LPSFVVSSSWQKLPQSKVACLVDASAVIKIDVELNRLQPKGMRDFDNKVVGVMDRS
jgi:hypothetical protein